MKKHLLAVSLLASIIACTDLQPKKSTPQSVNKTDSIVIKKLFNTALSKGQSYQWLDELSNDIGGRLSGSAEAKQAVEWGENLMKELKFDSVWLQPVMVPHWVRGEKEEAYFTVENTKLNMDLVDVWVAKGAIPTDTVKGLIAQKR